MTHLKTHVKYNVLAMTNLKTHVKYNVSAMTKLKTHVNSNKNKLEPSIRSKNLLKPMQITAKTEVDHSMLCIFVALYMGFKSF